MLFSLNKQGLLFVLTDLWVDQKTAILAVVIGEILDNHCSNIFKYLQCRAMENSVINIGIRMLYSDSAILVG